MICQLGGDDDLNKLDLRRSQRLVRLCGLTEPRARLIAGLAFGEALA
jgi:hypothetical protein